MVSVTLFFIRAIRFISVIRGKFSSVFHGLVSFLSVLNNLGVLALIFSNLFGVGFYKIRKFFVKSTFFLPLPLKSGMS